MVRMENRERCSHSPTGRPFISGDDVSVEGLTESGTFKSISLLKDKGIIKEVNKCETELQNIS